MKNSSCSSNICSNEFIIRNSFSYKLTGMSLPALSWASVGAAAVVVVVVVEVVVDSEEYKATDTVRWVQYSAIVTVLTRFALCLRNIRRFIEGHDNVPSVLPSLKPFDL